MELDQERVNLPGAGLTLAADTWRRARAPLDARGMVLLLHGGGQTRHSWRRTGERLAKAGWMAVAVDQRGHGESDWHPEGDYGMTAMIADLRSIVGEVKASHPGLPVVLVGASLGGKVSLIAAGEDPELARALVLVDIAVRVESSGSRRVQQFMRSAPNGFGSLQEAADAISAYNPHRKHSGNLEGLKKNLRMRNGRWHWHWDPAMMSPEGGGASDAPVSEAIYQRSKQAARNVSWPVMLVRGQQSDIVSDESVAEMCELIPHVTVVDVREVGHMVAGDDNDVFTANLVDYLDRAIPPD